MKVITACFATVLWIGVAATAWGHSYKLGALEVGHTWTTPTAAGVTTTPIYFPLLNTGADADALTGATSAWAEKIEIRRTVKDGQSEKLNELTVTPNMPIPMSKSGLYLYAVGLKRPLQAKDKMPLTLQFKKAGSIDVEAIVQAAP